MVYQKNKYIFMLIFNVIELRNRKLNGLYVYSEMFFTL